MKIVGFEEILTFWFRDPKKWFHGGEDFDREIIKNFSEAYEDAISGKLDDWINTPDSCLALIIILDQFSRNMFRGDPRSFEYDFKSLYTTKIALKKGFLEELSRAQKTFLIMPLMHSESLPDQDMCVDIFIQLSKSDNSYDINVKFAKEHLDIIKKFGRFPHRNKVLGRESTPEEEEFLKTHSGF